MNSLPAYSLVAALILTIPTYADVTITGSVNPSDPDFWSNGGDEDQTAIFGVTNNSTGSLTIDGGSSVTVYETLLGGRASSTGAVTVTGSGSRFSSRFMDLGEDGTGVLTVLDGGSYWSSNTKVASHLDSTGTFLISGSGSSATISTLMEIGGQNRSATVTVSNGGYLSSNTVYIMGANQEGKVSQMTVTGAGTRWDNSSRLHVGNSYKGELEISDGAVATARDVYFGDHITFYTKGTATVKGANSRWQVTEEINFNRETTNELHISDGAIVEAGGEFRSFFETAPTSYDADSGIWLDNGTLKTGAFIVSREQLHGQGTLETGNLIGTGYQEVLDFNGSATANFTLSENGDNLQMQVVSNGVGDLGVQQLQVRNGAQIVSEDGYVGYDSGVDAKAVVTDEGSEWDLSGQLFVGRFGNGTLEVSDGGKVTSESWINVYADGKVNLLVSGHQTLIEAANVSNNGMMYFFAAGGLAPGDYAPVSAITPLSGSNVEGIGGTWNEAGQVFTVSDALDGSGGLVNADVAGERVSFLPDVLELSFGVNAMDVTLSVAAEAVEMIDGQFVLGAYFFTESSAALGDMVMVSYFVGEGYEADDFSYWREASEDGEWLAFTPASSSYANGWVNFVVDGFSGYAVTSATAVPEPATGGLLLMAAASLVWRRRR